MVPARERKISILGICLCPVPSLSTIIVQAQTPLPRHRLKDVGGGRRALLVLRAHWQAAGPGGHSSEQGPRVEHQLEDLPCKTSALRIATSSNPSGVALTLTPCSLQEMVGEAERVLSKHFANIPIEDFMDAVKEEMVGQAEPVWSNHSANIPIRQVEDNLMNRLKEEASIKVTFSG